LKSREDKPVWNLLQRMGGTQWGRIGQVFLKVLSLFSSVGLMVVLTEVELIRLKVGHILAPPPARITNDLTTALRSGEDDLWANLAIIVVMVVLVFLVQVGHHVQRAGVRYYFRPLAWLGVSLVLWAVYFAATGWLTVDYEGLVQQARGRHFVVGMWAGPHLAEYRAENDPDASSTTIIDDHPAELDRIWPKGAVWCASFSLGLLYVATLLAFSLTLIYTGESFIFWVASLFQAPPHTPQGIVQAS
jgi:hypothetical protein